MQHEFAALKQSIVSKNYVEATQCFKRYCAAFIDEAKSEQPQSFFAKIVKKQTPLESGIEHFGYIIKSGVMKRIPFTELIQSITPLFQVLLHPFIKKENHIIAFSLVLDVVSALEDDAEKKDLSVKLLGDIIVYGFQLFQCIERPEDMYPDDLPNNIAVIEQDTSTLHIQLFDSLMEHIKKHKNHICFWWSLLCESLLSIYFGSTTCKFTFINRPHFKMEKISKLLCSDDVDEERISKLYPHYILQVIAETAEKSSVPFFDKFSDHLNEIFIEASKTNYSSVASFYVSILPHIGNMIKRPDNNQARLLFDKYNRIWASLIRSNEETAELIINEISTKVQTQRDPTTVYAALLMSYQLGKPIPKPISMHIKDMGQEVESVACAFAGVLAIVFMPQLLHLSKKDMEQIEDEAFTDCGTFFLKVAFRPNTLSIVPHVEMMRIIGSISIVHDQRPPLEVSPFIEQFFDGWKTDQGIHEMYSSFIRTLVMIIQSLPSSVQVDAKKILIPSMNEFTKVALETAKPKVVLQSVDVVSLIISTRQIVPHITPVATSKTALAHLKLISLNDSECIEVGILRASASILSGNPILMAIVPYLVTLVLSEKITNIQPIVVSAFEYAVMYFSQNEELIKKAVDSIENKMLPVLATIKDFLSPTASSYFIGNKKTLQSPFEYIISILSHEIISSKSEEVRLSFVRLIHGFSVLNMKIPPQVMNIMKQIKELDDIMIAGMYSFVDIADIIRKNNDNFLPNIIATLEIEYDRSFEKSSRPAAQIFILAYQLCIACGEWEMLSELFTRIKYNEVIDLLLSFMCERYTRPAIGTVSEESSVFCSSQNSLQIVHKNEQGETEVTTTKPTISSVHSFTTIKQEEEDAKEPPYETFEEDNDEEDVANEISHNTDQIFTRIIEEIKAQHEEGLLSVTNIGPKTPRKQSIIRKPPHDKSSSKSAMQKKHATDYDASLAAIGALGLFGRYGFEKNLNKQDILRINEIIQTEVKRTCIFPVYYAKGGKIEWKWEETSKTFQRFSHSLGENETSTTRSFKDWRINGKFLIMPSGGSTLKDKIIQWLKIVWCEDGVTIPPNEFHGKGTQATTVISIQPLRTGFVRIYTENIKSNNILLSGVKVIPGESLTSMLKTTVCSLYSSTETTDNPFSRGLLNQNNIEKVSHSFI